MAAAWDAEVVCARRLGVIAERVDDAGIRARLLLLSAFSRAHASRILARLASLGRGPLPVPDEDIDEDEDVGLALMELSLQARHAARRYESMAHLARNQADLSSAWVCELNHSEEQDMAIELARLQQEGAGTLSRPSAPPLE